MAKKKCFTEHDFGLSLTWTPEPLPCPFCGQDGASIQFGAAWAQPVCGLCGVELSHVYFENLDDDGGYDGFDRYEALALYAARMWNTRGRIEVRPPETRKKRAAPGEALS
jgi:hypothetical protein